jgi:bifunctional non-homologous end joining protein LigD
MSAPQLSEYKNKRKLKISPEPQAHIAVDKENNKELIFVIQKHSARHLHYDLRLELDGVLKSWAVPKGPPLSSQEKRLAIMVEDHPYDYKDFFGTIPAGHYGAGTVEIWDHGTYKIPGASTREQAENLVRAGLKKGHLSFELQGHKLHGYYTLLKTSLPGAKESWLWLIKNPPPTLDYEKMPTHLSPMLATLISEPFDDPAWVFEIKFDGFRALSYIKNNKISLLSRNNKLLNNKFTNIINNLQEYINHDVILDGEIVVLDKKGRSQFQLLQNYQQTHDSNLFYYIFDLLYLDGHDLRNLPLLERKAMLEQLLAPAHKSQLRYSDHIEKYGKKLFKETQKLGLEGIVAKNSSSVYEMHRSKSWLKIKNKNSQEAIICGFTKPRNSREKFGALILGIYEHKQLIYAGLVGTGFSDDMLKELALKLHKLVQKKCPFKETPKTSEPATFVKPTLVCEVSFSEYTHDGFMRHPVFKGLRPDKKAIDVSYEYEQKRS